MQDVNEAAARQLVREILDRAREHTAVPIDPLYQLAPDPDTVSDVIRAMGDRGWITDGPVDPQRGPTLALGRDAPDDVDAALDHDRALSAAADAEEEDRATDTPTDDAGVLGEIAQLPLADRLRACLARELHQLEAEQLAALQDGPGMYDGARAGATAALTSAVLAADAIDRHERPPTVLLGTAAGLLDRCAQMLANVQTRAGRLQPVGNEDTGFETTVPFEEHRVMPDGFEDLDPQQMADLARRIRPNG